MGRLLLCLYVSAVVVIAAAQEKTPLPPGKVSAPAVQTPASEQMATLVFYRPKRYFGSGLTPSVYVNGEQVARLDNGRFFAFPVKPSVVKIESSMKHDPLEVELKPGKTHFFEMVILAGNWRGGGRLIPTGANDAKEAVKKLKPLDKKWVTSEHVTYMLPAESTDK